MITLFDNDIAFSENVRFLKNKDTEIIINASSGVWGIIDNPMLEKVKYCISNKIPPAELINSLENIEDKKQLTEIFQTLIEWEMVESPNKENIKAELKEVEFKITSKCNLKCLHCGASCDINNKDILDTDEFKRICEKISQMNIGTLLLTGGEPLMRQDIKLLLPYIRHNFKGTINMITNGVLINREMAFLLKECVNAISISIDGYDEKSTDFIRGKGVYNKIVQAVNYLHEAGFSKDTIIFTMVLTKQNLDHQPDFYNLCEKLNVTGAVRRLTALGRALDNYESIGTKDYFSFSAKSDEELEDIRENLQCKIICKAGVKKITINQLGNIFPCLVLENEEYKLGNILDEDVNDLFNSDKYHRFIKEKIKKSVVDDISKCKNCNVRYFCMDSCLGVSNSIYNNSEICEEHCKQMLPYLKKVLWNE